MDIQQHNRFQKLFIDEFFLLDISVNKNDYLFKIAGSTNNVYTVRINKNYTNNFVYCDCPDSGKWCKMYNVICKHILFIIFRVIKLFKMENNLSRITVCENGKYFLEKKSINKDQLEIISVFCHLFNFKEPSDSFNINLHKRYNELSKKKDIEKPINYSHEDICTICFNGFSDEDIIKCTKCVGIYHKECIKKWTKFNNSCPYCRAPDFFETNMDSKYIKLSV